MGVIQMGVDRYPSLKYARVPVVLVIVRLQSCAANVLFIKFVKYLGPSSVQLMNFSRQLCIMSASRDPKHFLVQVAEIYVNRKHRFRVDRFASFQMQA